MAWALLNDSERPLTIGYWNENYEYVTETFDAEPGTIFSFIIYDGVSPYTPDDGFVLREVSNDKRVGDFIGL